MCWLLLTCLCRIFSFVYFVVPHFCFQNWFHKPSIRKLVWWMWSIFVSFTFAVLLFTMTLSSITLTKWQSDHHSGITDEVPGGEKKDAYVCVRADESCRSSRGESWWYMRWVRLLGWSQRSVVSVKAVKWGRCSEQQKKIELLLVYVCPGWMLELNDRVQASIQNQRL